MVDIYSAPASTYPVAVIPDDSNTAAKLGAGGASAAVAAPAAVSRLSADKSFTLIFIYLSLWLIKYTPIGVCIE